MKKLAIGIDIGGINTAFGLVDEQGELYGESVISTRSYPYLEDYPHYVDALEKGLRSLLDAVSTAYELVGIGIAVEKGFQHGGDRIREAGINIQSLAIIDEADENGFVFRGE